MKKSVISSVLLFCITTGFAQTKTANQILTIEVRKNISFARSFVYAEMPDFNIDSLCLVTAQKAVRVLGGKQPMTDLGLKLTAACKDWTGVKVFSFGYDCGGTRRWITHPILQWRNKQGKTFAYNFAEQINCDFNEIYKLRSPGRQLYLLIGQEAGDGSCYQSMVYVIEIKGDYLIVDRPVFANRPYLNFCNMEYDFDPKTQKLRGLLQHASVRRQLKSVIEEQGGYATSAKGKRELTDLIGEGDHGEPSIFILKFDGRKFVKAK